MEEFYTYFGYIMIMILLYLIYHTITRSKRREGFLGFGSENDKDSKRGLLWL